MSSQSPQRTRKPAILPGTQGLMQGMTPRDSTPSPSFRERQRAIKAHSLPNVPSVGQNLASQGQPSPTTATFPHQARRTPPPTSRISPVAAKMSVPRERSPERLNSPPPLIHSHSQPVMPHLIPLPPPGPSHAQSQSSGIPQVNQNPHHPRPINRVPPPPFLSQYQGPDDAWQMTDELIKQIEMADLQQAAAQGHFSGTAGVAYAGGAASSSISHQLQHSAAKDPAVERVRASDRTSPKDETSKRQVKDAQNVRESPKNRDRSQTISSIASVEAAVTRTPEYRGSPQYQTPMASPGERTATYTQYVPENYQTGSPQGPTPPVSRKPVPSSETAPTRLTPPATFKLASSSHTPPLQAMAARPPDRSLPVQEEPEEDVAVVHDYVDTAPDYDDRHPNSPTPSSDVYPEGRYDSRREHVRAASHAEDDDEDDQTLNEEVDEKRQQGKGSESSDSGFTPRSPSTNLPERPTQYAGSNGQYSPTNGHYASTNGQHTQANGDYQKTIRAARHRSGPTDQVGMRSFDPSMFEQTVNSLRGNGQTSPTNSQRVAQPTVQSQSQPQPQLQQPQISSQSSQPAQVQSQAQRPLEPSTLQAEAARQYAMSRQMAHAGFQLPNPEELQLMMEDPTSSYLRAYLQTPGTRPNAPIPPTPHSQTAAPSPSPLLSSLQTDAEPRQIGSPYPHPFTHIRRMAAAAQQAPSTNYDLNHPEAIREQLQLQMQIYALNNGFVPPSDSTFSPPATPYPGVPPYNWPFLPFMQAANGLGAGPVNSSMSIRSSPSHEPVQLPLPPMRGRGPRRREQAANVRAPQGGGRAQRRVKPPPRVESTQPRETSPEPSSGEETAGEFVDHYNGRASTDPVTAWMNENGNGATQPLDVDVDDEGEWVDEEEEGEEEDLLDLEFHPTYVNNPQKRRRRWETRWDALIHAFQALDRETDATLVLLASPPHSTKLHALTSRSVRRDPNLFNSPKLAAIRASFYQLSAARRNARSQRLSLVERLHLSSTGSGSSGDGSPSSGESREEDLRRALEAALGSLGELGKIYEQREVRWRDEMRQLTDDRDRVELLLRQALGPMLANGGAL